MPALAGADASAYIRDESVLGGRAMELRHLRYFVAVAEEATLVAAARRLGVAQPALTRQIHALERELDVELLERGPKGVSLTPAGDVALASARHVLRQVDVAVGRARGSGEGIAGRCVLCAGDRSLATGLLGRIVERVRARYPAIEIDVIEGAGERQLRALEVGDADVGIGIPAPKSYPHLASETIDYDVFDAAVFCDLHPFAKRESIALSELADETFLTWSPEVAPEPIRQIHDEFARLGFAPAASREFDNVISLSTAVLAGQGWALMFRSSPQLVPHGASMVPLVGFRAALPHAIVWRTDERRPVIRTVMNVVRDVAADERAMRDGHPASRAPTPARSVPAVTDRVPPSSVLELRHLRYFCSVVEAGSFGRAAEQLGLTQPALSRQVADLETVVAIPLLDRASRGVTATPAGEALMRSAHRILDEVGTMTAETQRARRGVIARCLIATVPTMLARKLVTELVRECARDEPELELVFEELATPEQPEALRSGHIDLGICHPSPLSAVDERGVERIRIVEDVMNCALVAERAPIASRRSISIQELKDVPFIFPDREFQPALHDFLFGHFESIGFRPRVDATYDGLRTIWQLVARGHGWAMGFASQCAEPPAGTAAVPIDELSIPWGLDLLARADEARSLILDVAERVERIGTTLN
jgi:DNA-binding transcriptional LysR family regulator